MKFYRIKQVSEDKFIPQISRNLIERIFCVWEGIEINRSRITFWHTTRLQHEYCMCNSLEEAKNVVAVCKEHDKKHVDYPKYHKV